MESQYHTLCVVHRFLIVCVNNERQRRPVRAHRRLNDIGHITPIVGLIVVREVPAGLRDVGAEVVIGPIRDSLQLAPTPRKEELNIRARFGVVRQLIGSMLSNTQLVRPQA